MPRRRSPPRPGAATPLPFSCSSSISSAIRGKPCDDRLAAGHLLADADGKARLEGQVDVDARAEADEAEALPLGERGAGVDVAEDAPGDEAGDLHAGDV